MFKQGLKFTAQGQNPASPEFQAKALTAARIAMVERFREDNRQFVESCSQSMRVALSDVAMGDEVRQ